MNRLKTGVPGLDIVLNGGLLEERTYLLLGAPGVGKTIMSLQFLLEGSRKGERCVCLNLIEPASAVENNARSFHWDLDGITMKDLTGHGVEAPGTYEVFAPSEVESSPIFKEIYDTINEIRPQRLVIDSVTQLRHVAIDDYQFRKQILALILHLSKLGCTTLLTHEPNQFSKEIYTALAVDGIIRLRRELSEQKAVEVRSLEVQKFRGSDYRAGVHYFRFKKDGIHLFPRLDVQRDVEEMSDEQLKSGIKSLDDLLGGGIEIGTTTLISGPTGVGKSTMVAQFLSQAAKFKQKKCLYLSFEEAPSSILKRNDGLGIPLWKLVDDGKVALEYVHPRQYYPSELAIHVRSFVEQGYEVVALDGIRGYEFAMEPFGSAVNNLNNLLSELGAAGVSVFLTNEVEVIAGGELKATETGASHMCDNLLLMRYSEYKAEVIKLIGCLKKRLSPFEPELRRVRIRSAPDGLEVGPKLRELRGILTGVPTLAQEET